MYLWKTKQLVEDLRRGPLGEIELKNYYLATSIITVIGFYLTMLESRENMPALAMEAIGVVVITIFGINAAFKANGGSEGSRFIEKAVSISFPLLIKVLVAGFFWGLVIGIATAIWITKCQGEWAGALGMLLIQIAFIWRLIVHVRATNA